jgi:hypothetical protein
MQGIEGGQFEMTRDERGSTSCAAVAPGLVRWTTPRVRGRTGSLLTSGRGVLPVHDALNLWVGRTLCALCPSQRRACLVVSDTATVVSLLSCMLKQLARRP